jgi:hypothetical protein
VSPIDDFDTSCPSFRTGGGLAIKEIRRTITAYSSPSTEHMSDVGWLEDAASSNTIIQMKTAAVLQKPADNYV